MFESPKIIKAYAQFWLILALVEFAYVIGLNIYDAPSNPDENLSIGFLLFGLLNIGFMATVAIVALRTNRRWLQIITVIILGMNPILVMLPLSSYVFWVFSPVNFIVMCFVLYSVINTRPPSGSRHG